MLSPVDPPQEAQLVQRMMNGEVQFNISTGRVVGQKMDIDKRILGFAGATSSLQYVMKMEEKLLEPQKKVAAQPPAPAQPYVAKLPPGAPAPPDTKANEKALDITPVKETSENETKPAAAPRSQSRPTRSANRPKTNAKGYRTSVR